MRDNLKNRKTPLENRVAPDGLPFATSARGTLMGNRGILHTSKQTLKHPRTKFSTTKAWICCRLQFKDRQRIVMAANRYTELFFLDEATAAAAGHRPCFECRRADAKAFAGLWQQAFALNAPPKAPQMDAILHTARRSKPENLALASLPDRCFFNVDGTPFVTDGSLALMWSPEGYQSAHPLASFPATVTCLTCQPMRQLLSAGWQPALHPSASNLVSA